MEEVEAQEITEEVAKQDTCIGQDNPAVVEDDDDYENDQEQESEGDNPPSEELFDDFFTDEFLEGLDVVDSWVDEGDECDEENQERNNEDKNTTNSSRHAGSKVSDRTVKINSTSRQDNRKANSSGKKDERNNLKGKSAKERSSHREDGRSRGRGSERQRNERSSDRKDSGVTSRERNSEKKDGGRTRREGSLEKKDEGRNLRYKSLERIFTEVNEDIQIRSIAKSKSRNEPSSSRREGNVDKREEARKGGRVLHREKSSEKKPSSSRLDDRNKRERSRDRKNTKRSTRKVDRKHPQAPDKNLNLKVAVCSQSNVENARLRKGVAEIGFPKKPPHITLNEPIPPGTEEDYLIVETIPDMKHITALSRNDITIKLEKEYPISSEKYAKKRESNKTDKIKSRSPVTKRRQRHLKSGSTDRSSGNRLDKSRKRDLLSGQTDSQNQREISKRIKALEERQAERMRSRNRKLPPLELKRRKRSLSREKIGPPRARSREEGKKRDRSYDRDRHPSDLKRISRPLSPEVYRRLTSPRPCLQPGRGSLARTRSLSRERKESGRHSRRLHRNSLSPVSISGSSLTLTSESEYERSKLQYIDSPRKEKRKLKKKPNFLKELAGILAAHTHKGPQPAYPGGQQNAPHLEMRPHPGIYAPNLNNGLVLPINYPPPSFKPVGSAPAGYPMVAYPEHLPGPSTATHPCPPTDGIPLTDFVFTLHTHNAGRALPGVKIMDHPQVGQPLQVMNSPVIQSHFSYASSSTPTIPPPPVISNTLLRSGRLEYTKGPLSITASRQYRSSR